MHKKINNPREIAFLALLHFQKGGFIEDFFKSCDLVKKDLSLAEQIAYSTIRRLYTLDFIAKKITSIKLKNREKLLLFSGLCQYFFMDRVPLFAINNETTGLAKKYFGQKKAAFFNFFFHKLSSLTPDFKQFFDENFIDNWSNFYSYPDFFIKQLINDRGLERAKEILEELNQKAPLMFRKRFGPFENLKPLHDALFKVYEISDASEIKNLALDKSVYIQNITPLLLIEEMVKNISYPKNILDLCSAPGGKIIALHDLFPKANLFANDKTAEKINLINENLKKYGIEAVVEMQDGKTFSSSLKYDLLILDVPCSNSGVLHKRVEARYRLNEKNLEIIENEQFLLLKRAKELLAENGQIWYMTCSILKRENEGIVSKASDLGLKVKDMLTILPSKVRDGGFAACLY